MKDLSVALSLSRDRQHPYLRSPSRPGLLLVAGARLRVPVGALLRPAGLALALALGLGLPGPAAAQSILERVLTLLLVADPGDPFALLANIAENSGRYAETPLGLEAGSEVVIGFDALGNAITATATEIGVLVSPAQAGAMASGLAAGFYPLGSQLYDLPPGARYSLYEAAADGSRLEAARGLIMTRIDGRISTVLALNTAPAELVETAAFAFAPEEIAAIFEVRELRTTVLGAVNAGTTVSQIDVTEIVGPIGATLDVVGADLARGAAGLVEAAATTSSRASRSATQSVAARTHGLNIASNSMTVTGAIVTVVRDRNAAVLRQLTTVLGAVNSGVIRIGQ